MGVRRRKWVTWVIRALAIALGVLCGHLIDHAVFGAPPVQTQSPFSVTFSGLNQPEYAAGQTYAISAGATNQYTAQSCSWTVTGGSFSDANACTTTWTAPLYSVSQPLTFSVSMTAWRFRVGTATGTGSTTVQVAAVVPPTPTPPPKTPDYSVEGRQPLEALFSQVPGGSPVLVGLVLLTVVAGVMIIGKGAAWSGPVAAIAAVGAIGLLNAMGLVNSAIAAVIIIMALLAGMAFFRASRTR